MWSSIMAPTGHSLVMHSKQHHREFGMFVSTPILPGKSFKNPNFVNNYNKYNHNLKSIDNSQYYDTRNFCQNVHIIDSIKEKCPEAIPSFIADKNSETMCLDNSSTHSTPKQRKREHIHTPKSKKITKKLKKHINRKDLREMMEEDNSQEISNHSLDNTLVPKPHTLILRDFLPTPVENSSLSTPIPLPMGSFIISPPNRSQQYSVTDSEDSFIIFDHEVEKNKRPKLPSVCESEDSFIVFDGDDLGCLEDNDICFEDDSEESGEDSMDETDQDSDSTDVDSTSFSIVDRKKVRFASDDKLCEVHPMVKWSYAYQAARKGPWEMYARDRSRFKERVFRVERDIKHIFEPNHRAQVFQERFEHM